MYKTQVLDDFSLPRLTHATLQGETWSYPRSFVAVIWASPHAFRRAGIWTRLLGAQPWVQILLNADSEELEAIVPASLLTRSVLAKGILSDDLEQVVAVLVVDGKVHLAMQDSPTEDAWESFEGEMTRLLVV